MCAFLRRAPWVAVFFALFLHASSASARSQRDLAYRSELAWTTAVRLLRVDLGFQLVERDQEARFILFRYVEGEHAHPGSLEIVERALEDGRTGVRVIVSVPALPSYVELHLIDRLERKLRDEVGAPLPVPERRRQNPSRDQDDDDDDDDDEASEGEESDDDGDRRRSRDRNRDRRRERD